MPTLESEIVQFILNSVENKYPIFIESGTYRGDTIFKMEPLFDTLHTIEIKEEFYNTVKNLYNGTKINFHLGASEELLCSIIQLHKHENIMFFLDGHWSSGNTGKGIKDCPLDEEISMIINNLEGSGIIIIDDFRLFGLGPNNSNEITNWEKINKSTILNLIGARLIKEYHMPSALYYADRWIIHIAPKS